MTVLVASDAWILLVILSLISYKKQDSLKGTWSGLAFHPMPGSLEDPGIPGERIKQKNIVVFIGPIDSMEEIGRTVETGNWSKGEVFQPKS
jgi:hypothetical protein